MAGKEPIRVYLAAQYDIVRSGLSSLLDAEWDIEVVGRSGLASMALTEILDLRPDVAVLDSRLPDGSGLGLCRAVRAADPNIRALMLSGLRDDDAIATAMLAGAAGYLLEQVNASSLVNGIRLVASGHSVVDWSVPASVVEHVTLHKRSLQVIADLTPQQRKILFLIAEGLTNREIAERLFLAEKTVKNHVTALLARLGVSHRTQAAMMAATWARAEAATSRRRRLVGRVHRRQPEHPDVTLGARLVDRVDRGDVDHLLPARLGLGTGEQLGDDRNLDAARDDLGLRVGEQVARPRRVVLLAEVRPDHDHGVADVARENQWAEPRLT